MSIERNRMLWFAGLICKISTLEVSPRGKMNRVAGLCQPDGAGDCSERFRGAIVRVVAKNRIYMYGTRLRLVQLRPEVVGSIVLFRGDFTECICLLW